MGVPRPQENNEGTPLLFPPENQPQTSVVDSYGTTCSTHEESGLQTPSGTSFQLPPSISPNVIVLVLTFGVFIAQLDTSFVLATHSNIASEFGQLSNSSWLVVSYALAMCASQPVYGKLSDIYGRKESLVVSYCFFATGCAICGFSKSLSLVVVGRIISGIGGAGCNVLVSLIILDLVPLRQVASLRSYVNVAATTGRSLGGPIGGFLADTVGWRWSFLGQAPLIAISALLAWVLIPHKSSEEHSDLKKARFARIDFAGATLLGITITTFLLVVELAGQRLPWNHPIIFALFGASVASGVLFVLTEVYWAAEPIFPPRLLLQRDVFSAYLVFGLQVAAQLSMMFCVPLYFQVTENASASVAGAHLFPAVAGNAIGALLSGLVIKRTGRYKVLTTLATVTAATSYALLILRWHGRTGFWEALYIVPGGFGTGMAEASVFVGLTASVAPGLQAIALSGLFLASNVGVIAGLAASSAVLEVSLRSGLRAALEGDPDKDKIIRRAVSDISYVLGLKGPLRDLVAGAYVQSLEYTHGVSLACVVLAFVVSLFLRQRAL